MIWPPISSSWFWSLPCSYAMRLWCQFVGNQNKVSVFSPVHGISMEQVENYPFKQCMAPLE